METDLILKWYGSVAGIVFATIAAVEALKAVLSDVPALRRVPTWVYTIAIAGALTWFAHDVLVTLPGDNIWRLIVDAVTMALASSGGLEWFRTRTKPIAASGTSLDNRDLGWMRKKGGWKSVLSLVLAIGLLSSACAPAVMSTARTVHGTVAFVQDKSDQVCATGLVTATQCEAFRKTHLVPLLEADIVFLDGAARNSLSGVPTMVRALIELEQAIESFVPDAAVRAEIRQRIAAAVGLVRSLGGRKQ